MHPITVKIDLDVQDGEVAFIARGVALRKDSVNLSLLAVSESLQELKDDILEQAAEHFPQRDITFYLSEQAWKYAGP